MIRAHLIILLLLIFGCNSQKSKSKKHIRNEKVVAVLWTPMEYYSLRESITDHITFPGHDTLKYLPSDRDLILNFEFTGKMKEYMEHGKMIVRPYQSSVHIKRIDNHSFKLRVNKPIDDWHIKMYFEFSFDEPYYFSYIQDSITYQFQPKDTVALFMRSEMTKPGDPWDYIK